VPQKKVLPLLWNKKEWTVTASAKISYTRTAYGISSEASYEGSISGKFIRASHADYFDAYFASVSRYIESTNDEPMQNPAGRVDRSYQFSVEANESVTDHDAYTPHTIPGVDLAGYFGFADIEPASFSVNDKSGNESGDYSVSQSFASIIDGEVQSGNSGSGYLEFIISRIYVRTNGSADVFVSVRCGAGDSGGPVRIARKADDNNVNVGDVEFTFLGVKTAAILTFSSASDDLPTPGAFELSYDIAVAEEWTY
jgi:hypothetical protein